MSKEPNSAAEAFVSWADGIRKMLFEAGEKNAAARVDNYSFETFDAGWQAAIAHKSEGAVPTGFKIVPVEPTWQMETAAEDDYEKTGATFPDRKSAYRAMLASIPAERCGTCNGHGMIGGPSYSAPDEGGEPCPDCNVPAVQTAEQYIATLPADWHNDSSLETWFPLTSQELESNKRMFMDACSALGLIDEALGISPDESGGAGPIIDAIEELKAQIVAPAAPVAVPVDALKDSLDKAAAAIAQLNKGREVTSEQLNAPLDAALRAAPAPHSGEAVPSDEYKIAYQEGHFEGYQQARREISPDGYLYGDHEHTFDCPDDAAMMGGRKVGDRYTVTAVFYEQQEFEVTKVADGVDDDWAVRLVDTSPDAVPIHKAEYKCAARASVGPHDPQECDWPLCGCDPHADKVIAALQESGKLAAPIGEAGGVVAEPVGKSVFVLPISVAKIIDGAFLPTNPNKMRNAHPDTVAAAKIFKEALQGVVKRTAAQPQAAPSELTQEIEALKADNTSLMDSLNGEAREVDRLNALFKAAPSELSDAQYLSADDMAALVEFNAQCEDSEADGYTVRKESMKRLAELGSVQSLGFGRYGVTAFGAWLVERHFEQSAGLPLRTVDEHNVIAAASTTGSGA